MNKGLEVIEARWLFDFSADEIAVIVHPQSVVHSMVEMIDGSIIAQLGVTDMKHAIQYALTFPKRQTSCLPPLGFAKLSQLTFEEPDLEKFSCLALAYRALRVGGTMPATLNAANEIAVKAFLDGEIRLSDVPKIIETVMNEHEAKPVTNLETVLECDEQARRKTRQKLMVLPIADTDTRTKIAEVTP
jgi:1-deoxy-D-xylulose-5-phosphate reductoisomerase